MIMLENQNVQFFLLKLTFQVGVVKRLRIEKVKTVGCGHVLLVILMVTKYLETFRKNNCKKEINKSLELKM